MPTRMVLSLALQLLSRRPEQDLVHVHVLRLAHGERDCPRSFSYAPSSYVWRSNDSALTRGAADTRSVSQEHFSGAVECSACSIKGHVKNKFILGVCRRIFSWTACPFSVGSCYHLGYLPFSRGPSTTLSPRPARVWPNWLLLAAPYRVSARTNHAADNKAESRTGRGLRVTSMWVCWLLA